MNYAAILQIIQIALALVETGSAAATFLQSISERVTAAQTAGTELTDDDWAFLDAQASENLAVIQKLAGTAS